MSEEEARAFFRRRWAFIESKFNDECESLVEAAINDLIGYDAIRRETKRKAQRLALAIVGKLLSEEGK